MVSVLTFRQLQYAVMLSEAGSFSHLAESLNITQPALSKLILSLEKELDIQLFDRSCNPIALTAAGEYFIQKAKELLFEETQLLKTMEKFKSGEKGKLVIGVTPFRSSYLISKAIKKTREKFPGIQIKLVEEGNETLKKDAADGKFDFAVVNLPVDEDEFDVTLIEPDRLVLVAHRDLIEANAELKGKKEVDFKSCEKLPFAVVGENQEMRVLFEKLCKASGVHPEIATEVVSLTTAWEMVCCGIAATLLPLQFIESEKESEKVVVIELKNKTSLRRPAVAVKQGQYLSPYAKYAIEELTGKKC